MVIIKYEHHSWTTAVIIKSSLLLTFDGKWPSMRFGRGFSNSKQQKSPHTAQATKSCYTCMNRRGSALMWKECLKRNITSTLFLFQKLISTNNSKLSFRFYVCSVFFFRRLPSIRAIPLSGGRSLHIDSIPLRWCAGLRRWVYIFISFSSEFLNFCAFVYWINVANKSFFPSTRRQCTWN